MVSYGIAILSTVCYLRILTDFVLIYCIILTPILATIERTSYVFYELCYVNFIDFYCTFTIAHVFICTADPFCHPVNKRIWWWWWWTTLLTLSSLVTSSDLRTMSSSRARWFFSSRILILSLRCNWRRSLASDCSLSTVDDSRVLCSSFNFSRCRA